MVADRGLRRPDPRQPSVPRSAAPAGRHAWRGVGHASLRAVFVRLHRVLGLTTALFLIVSGLTGAIISWDHELDDLLNAHLMTAPGRGPALPPLALASRLEATHPDIGVAYLPLSVERGRSLSVSVEPRLNPATGRLHEPGYNEVFLDPVTGEELGRREWGQAWPITRETFVSFLYQLHYTLHIPEMWGIDAWGMWLMGTVALIWTIDCFIGFYLTLPGGRPKASRQAGGWNAPRKGFWSRWAVSWRIKARASFHRLNLDLHRAVSLWTFAFLLVLAFTAFSLNLYREIFYPVMSVISEVTPDPFGERTPAPPDRPIEPRIDRRSALRQASLEAQRRGWTTPVGSIAYSRDYGIYSVAFFAIGDDHGAAGVGPAVLYFDASDGRYLGDRQPWVGTAADMVVQAQFPLHSGRILGLPGRILISAMGLVVAMLSVTGVIIWWRKRSAKARGSGENRARSRPTRRSSEPSRVFDDADLRSPGA